MTFRLLAHVDKSLIAATEPAHFERDDAEMDSTDGGWDEVPQRSPLILSGMTAFGVPAVRRHVRAATEPAHFERDDSERDGGGHLQAEPQRSPLILSGMTLHEVERDGTADCGPQRSPLILSGMTASTATTSGSNNGAATEPAHFERDDRQVVYGYDRIERLPQRSPLILSGLTRRPSRPRRSR